MSINDGDQGWVLLSAALVQIMTPGVAFFYGGLVSEAAVVNTMMLSYGTMGVVTVLWSLIGYSMAFGPSTPTGVIGTDALAELDYGDNIRKFGFGDQDYLTVTESAYSMFQLMFAIITPALISGAVVGKIKFWWWMLFVALWHIFCYTPLAHWIFSYNGFFFQFGAIDYAGGMVVHTASGVSAFVLAYWLGRPKTPRHTNPHNVPYVLLGAALLWFGWFGFNAGSALAAGTSAGRVFTNTQLAPAMAMITWAALEVIFNGDKWFTGRSSAVGAASAAIIGLVGITPACGFVTPMSSLCIGFLTVLFCFFVPRLTRLTGVDDTLDVFAFHGVGGIVGSLLTGLFASREYGASPVDGAFYGNGVLFGKQIAVVLATVLMSTVTTTIIYFVMLGLAKLLKTTITIPVELQHDVDRSQHGETAYFKPVTTAATDKGRAVVAAPAPAKASEVAPEEDAAVVSVV